MARNQTAQVEEYDDEQEAQVEGKKKPRRAVGPRQMVAIVTVAEDGKVNLEAASYNAAALLTRFGELSRNGANPQILNIVRS